MRGNKLSILVGVLVGGIVTRFMEDGNLLITSVFTLICAAFSRLIWEIVKKFLSD